MSPEAALEFLCVAGGTVLHPLRHGPLADSWLVEVAGERAVLRIDQPAAAAMGLDRAAEFARLKVVAAAGLGPAPIAADPGRGLLLRRYIEGSVWQPGDLQQPARLAQAAILLRNAHSVAIERPSPDLVLDLAAAVERYAGLAGQEGARLAETTRHLLASCQDPGARRVFCHNDPVADNFVAGPGPAGRLWLIDWEYSGFNEFWFDLAVVVTHHALPPLLARDFLGAYLGHPPTGAELHRLAAWCSFYASFAELWFVTLAKYSANHP
jgi:thiamine kinase-like enzyme